jgi:hypothetical protein
MLVTKLKTVGECRTDFGIRNNWSKTIMVPQNWLNWSSEISAAEITYVLIILLIVTHFFYFFLGKKMNDIWGMC